MSEEGYQRFGVGFDEQMKRDQKIIEQEMEREGIKANRSSAVRYALRKTAQAILDKRKNSPKP